jgi:predicted DNA binding CopG/RHH family protein
MLLQIEIENEIIENLGKNNIENMIKNLLIAESKKKNESMQFNNISDEQVIESFKKISILYHNTLKELAN